MTKFKSTYLVLLAVLLAPMAAQADLIAYDFTGSSDSGWEIAGEVVLDDADAIAYTNLASAFTSWAFSWSNGIDTYTVTSLDSLFTGGDVFGIDNFGNVISAILCTNSCGFNDTSHIVTTHYWDATTGPGGYMGGDCCVSAGGMPTGQWSAARAVDVPEPGTLALFGLGLVGMGVARRRRKV